jgi:hypothetical protein
MSLNFPTPSGHVVNSPGVVFYMAPGLTIGLYGEVVLCNRNATRPDFESVFPLEQPPPLQYLLWDHRGGFQTVSYLANDSTSPWNVVAQFRQHDEPGNHHDKRQSGVGIIPDSESWCDRSSNQRFRRYARNPCHRRERERCSLLTATALRLNPSNSFTPIRAFIPK